MSRYHPIRMFLGAVALVVTGACGSAGGDGEGDGLEQSLSALPDAYAARASALDALYARYPGDPRLDAEMREFEREHTQGLIRRVELPRGRFVSFVALSDGGVVIAQGGPHGVPSIVTELGLESASPAELWESLVPDAPVPDVLLQGPSAAVEGAEVPVGSEARPMATTMTSSATKTFSENLGTSREAFDFADDDDFTDAGGCANRPSPSASDYRNIVDTTCAVLRTRSFGETHSSEQLRTQTHIYDGSSITVQISREGSPVFVAFLPLGSWLNTVHVNGTVCNTRCCGPLGSCFKHCTDCSVPSRNWQAEVLDVAGGDEFHIGAVWFNDTDSRSPTQPWL